MSPRNVICSVEHPGQATARSPSAHNHTPAMTEKAALQAPVQPGHDWTVVLRRQPTRMVDGQPQGGYTDVFELICCDRGDDPDLD